ncbi:antirepressor AbbA [Geobacillus stearothermophilus]|uniref:antirepressor AbbA n=1 Tax=Geobacillus stearothermophilus TaxID=1422 RepID=UPI003D1D2C64
MTKRLPTRLSGEEASLLLEVMFSQQYALELVRSELADIENGDKEADEQRYRQLLRLYDRLLTEEG